MPSTMEDIEMEGALTASPDLDRVLTPSPTMDGVFTASPGMEHLSPSSTASSLDHDSGADIISQKRSRTPLPPTPILEHTRIATTNRVSPEDFEIGGKFDFELYPPFFVQGALTSPATLSHVLGRERSGLSMTRFMLPGLLKTIHFTEQRSRVGCNIKGFVVFGHDSTGMQAVEDFHGASFNRLAGDVIVVLSDGTARSIDAIMWHPGTE